MKKFSLLLASMSIAALSLGQGGQMHGRPGRLDPQDRQFVMKAAMGGQAEVELGRLAARQGSSPDVRQFGQRMVDDHSRANRKLMRLAGDMGVMVPHRIDDEGMRTMAKLSRLHGRAFDLTYRRAMIDDHQTDIGLFRDEARGGRADRLVNFAKDTLPTLQDHLRMAQMLRTR